MDVTCESCRASYKVDDAKIPPQGIKAKCPKCGHSFVLKKPEPVYEEPVADTETAIPLPDDAPPPPPAAASAPAASSFDFGAATSPAEPFSGGFGGTPEGFGGAAPAVPGFEAPPSAAPAPAPAANAPVETFGGTGGVFGAGGFGGGFAPPADGGQAGNFAGMFQSKTTFAIRRRDGQEVGPFDMFHIKQMIYEQQLDGTEEVNDASGHWVPITSVEELGEIFRLTGGNVAPAPAASPAPPSPSPMSEARSPGISPRETRASREDVEEPVRTNLTEIPIVPRGATRPGPAQSPVATFDRAPSSLTFRERILIGVEEIWAATKTKSVQAVLGVVGGLVVVALLGLLFKGRIYSMFGWDMKIQAETMIAEGDKSLDSGERKQLLAATSKYREANAKAETAAGDARIAEVGARIWWRDPVRLDLRVEAEASIARAEKLGKESVSLHRAKAALALAKHDLAGAESELKAADAQLTGEASDPFLPGLQGDAAFEKGDMGAADAAYRLVPGPRGKSGIARVKVKNGDFAAAKAAAEEALKSETENGIAQAIAAFAGARTGGDAEAARQKLRAVAAGSGYFAQDRARAEAFLGVLAEDAQQSAAALAHYRAALSLYPVDADTQASAKRLFAARFPSRSADAWLTAVSRVRGSTAMGKILEGEAQYAAHNWTGAMTPLLAATTEDAGSARAQLAFGRLETAISNIEAAKAKGFFEKALAADPDYTDAALELSHWHLANNDAAAARASAEKAIGIDPTLPAAYDVAAEAAVAAKDLAAAEGWLVTATELDPEHYATWMNLGEVRRLAGNPTAALDPLRKASALEPTVAEPLIRLGNALEDLGNLKDAADAYTRAAKIEPTNVKLGTRMGVVKIKNGDYNDGERALEAVVKDHPEVAEAHFYLGIAFQLTNEPEKAAEAFKQAVKHDYKDLYLAHFHLGEIYFSPGTQSDRDQSREHLRAALKLKPDLYQAHEELSKVALSGNEFDEAVRELKLVDESASNIKAAERNPILVRVRLQQGKIARAQNHTREAEADFNQVLKIDPASAEALFNIGDLFRETEPRKAKQYYLKAMQANPSFAPPYKPAGYMLKDEGNECGARKYWQKFLELTNNPDEKKEIQDLIPTVPCGR